jgi:CubicO group peptidase (beta-lactamase class C family)
MLPRTSLTALVFVFTSLRAADIQPSALDRIIETTRTAWDVPGIAVAIVHGEDTVYIKGFGVKRAGSLDAVTADTRFAIGSCTKAFTTTAMALLVDDGKMAWDDRVREHLPYFHLSDPLADANVTMRDIVCHRTGLSRHDALWYNSPWSREEIIRKIGLVPLTRPFRSAYQYQNIMFLTAGETVGRIAGTSWEDVVTRRLLAPLGMTNTDLSVRDVVKAPDHATPHERRDNKIEAIDWRNIDNIGPAGSIDSSVRDLTRWIRLHLDEGTFEGKVLLKPASIHETHTPQMVIRTDDPASRAVNEGTHMMSYGMGWTIQDYRGHHMVSHGGAIDGYRAMIALLPDEHYGIAILANLGGNNMPECLRGSIVDELLGLPAKDWNAVYLDQRQQAEARAKKQKAERDAKRHQDTKPSLTPQQYSGTYEHPAYGAAQVRETNGKLELTWSNWTTPLEHWHFDTFRATGKGSLNDSLVEFRLTANGEVESVRFLDQEFRRKLR